MQFELLVQSLTLLQMIPVILVMLLMLWGVFAGTGRSRNLSLLSFLIALSYAISLLSVSAIRMDWITMTDWVNWGSYVGGGMIGIYLALLIIYVTIWAFPNFFSEHKWAIIVALIGPIVYELLHFMSGTELSSDLGLAWAATYLILAVLYMAVIPLYATFHYTRQDRIRGSPLVKWTWVVLIGLLFWFFGEATVALSVIMQWPGYLSFFSEIGVTIVSMPTIGWYLILVGFVFQRRAIQSAKP
ncbi:MAG: hypothetical protein JSW05_11020 [Candidatus Thorarchaeota archaeon]|nr:MAG: hypothetical protein JSW05_11020 [Candidatus Thorarchaeota archaeon]